MTKFLVLNFHAKHQIFNELNTWRLGAVNKLSKITEVLKEKIRKEKGDLYSWQIEREITYDPSIIRNRFNIEKTIFEVNINLFRPYLLIMSNEALRLLKDFYEITKNRIQIGEFDYQYVVCDILRPGEISFEEWEALPYRGKGKENEILIKKRKRRDD